MTTKVIIQENLVNGLFALVKGNIQVIAGNATQLRNAYDKTIAKILETEKLIRENKFLPYTNGADIHKAQLPVLNLQAEHLKMAFSGYPNIINLSFLSKVREIDRLPVFMILDLEDKGGFGITVRPKQEWGTGYYATFHPTSLPQTIKDLYKETVKELENIAHKNYSPQVSISATYSGLVSKDIQTVIEQAYKSKLFLKIFVITEGPKDWKTKIVKGDPLVVGYTGLDFYLITIYDPTDLEKAVAAEHIFSLSNLSGV